MESPEYSSPSTEPGGASTSPPQKSSVAGVAWEVDRSVVKIRLRVVGPGPQEPGEFHFWTAVRGDTTNVSATTVDRLSAGTLATTAPSSVKGDAAKFHNEFGAELTAAIGTYLGSLQKSRSASAPALIFRVRGFTYGSLFFGLDAIGAKEVMSVLGLDAETVRAMLETYVPLAFSGLFDAKVPLECKVEDLGAFEALVKPASDKSSLESVRKNATWFWVVSNTSLVVPVVIAAVVLWKLADNHSQERAELHKQFTLLSQREVADQTAHMERADRVLKVALELANARLPASAASGTTPGSAPSSPTLPKH